MLITNASAQRISPFKAATGILMMDRKWELDERCPKMGCTCKDGMYMWPTLLARARSSRRGYRVWSRSDEPRESP
ncbi:hypothetical protein J6590_033283 [Homalodisca vitripennis]|nr:hypothetical protein J6590_033283 [Homalodisca vitripennis]